MTGDLTLRVDNDGSSIRTFFSKWLPRFEDTKSSERRGGAHLPNDFADVATCTLKVDTKKLSAALQWQSTMIKTASTALLCMVENEMLVVHVLLNPASVGFFTYYVPVHFLSSTELG
jgi:HUS1 checkpoint protein